MTTNQKTDLSRRNFMKTTAASVAVLSLNSVLAVDTAPKKIRIGVVGGGFGSAFLWHLHPDCEVYAVSDLIESRKKALMEIMGCSRSYPSLEELVKDPNIDAVAIFTDGPLHVQHTVEALKHGKHVISAVPAAWATLEQAEQLADIVKTSGLTYMMAETGYYHMEMISVRKMFEKGEFGHIYYTEAEYQHDGLEALYWRDGKKTWRYGIAPMFYPTHSTVFVTGLTGETLTEVVCHGWGNDAPCLKDNDYANPFWSQTALFKTDRGNSCRVFISWKGAHRGTERATWIGDKMSFYCSHPNGMGPLILRSGEQTETDEAGFVRNKPNYENYKQEDWSRELPEPLGTHPGYGGCPQSFLIHEFISALTQNRKPAIDIRQALAYTVPGIIAHQSALQGGTLLKIPVLA